MDQIGEKNFILRLTDVIVLFLLVIVIFYSSFWLNIKWSKLTTPHKITYNFLFLFLISLVSIYIHRPIWKFATHIPVGFYVRDEFVRNFTILLISFFAVKFYKKNIENQEIKNAYTELQNKHLSSQVTGLMQQINPHFFFNTLNTLSGLVQESPEKSEVFIDKLSRVFRYVLKMQENNKVLLTEELNFAEDYIYLLKMRFDDKLIIVFNVQQDINAKIPTLCTQFLIENVIKHNKINRQFPVQIVIEIQNDYLKISNTLALQKSSNSIGIGLKNLNQRSELLSGKSIIVDQSDKLFSVSVPLIKE